MKKYLYFWVEKYQKLNDENQYLLKDFGVSLSSHNFIRHEWDSEILKIDCDYPKDDSVDFFYSENIVDLKVFVGDNGCGKTTLLTALFQLVADGLGEPPAGMGNYALIYEENEKIYIKTSLNDKCLILPKLIQRISQNNSHVSNYAIYYSTTFDDQEYRIENMVISGDLHGTMNVSTNALIFKDQESYVNESSLVDGMYPGHLDALQCYYGMEQQRKTEFLCDFINEKDFWIDFNLPRNIQLTVIYANVQNAFYELVSLQIISLTVNEFISANCLQGSRWGGMSEYPKAGLLNDLKKDVFEQYESFYDNLRLTDQFRFAAMMNFFRTWKDHNIFNFDNFNYKNFKNFKKKENFSFDEFVTESIFIDDVLSPSSLVPQLKGFINKVNSILLIIDGFIEKRNKGFATYQNGFMNNNKVYFDLHEHKDHFVNAMTLYNLIQKESTSPFLYFGFGRALSSGESAMIKLYSRLYYALKKQQEGLDKEEIHFFLDEIDLYLHPEWQRQWLKRFINGLKYIENVLNRKLKFQIFLSTHSPFMLTDFLTENLLLLRREDVHHGTHIVEYTNADSSNGIFGANIYDLVDSGFFLKNTIGYFAENKIKKYIENPSQEDYKNVVEKIGDPVLKVLIDTTINGRKRK